MRHLKRDTARRRVNGIATEAVTAPVKLFQISSRYGR